MKRYLCKCVVMAAAVLLPFVLWFGYVLYLPDYTQNNIAATIRYKTDLIRQTEGERIILVGGSSSPYGTNCAMAAEQLDRNVINVGATAYLGLDFYLNYIETYARTGDVVVLAPEFVLMTSEGVDYSLMWVGAATDLEVWRAIPTGYYAGMFSSIMDYYKIKMVTKGENTARPDPTGHNSDFGPLGDVTAYRELILEKGYNAQDLYRITPEAVWDNKVESINKTAARLKSKGITLLYAFPPVDELAIISTPQQVQAYERKITDGLQIPVILPMSLSIMEGKYFYDSNNHLNTAGAEIYTQHLIDGIRTVVGRAE